MGRAGEFLRSARRVMRCARVCLPTGFEFVGHFCQVWLQRGAVHVVVSCTVNFSRAEEALRTTPECADTRTEDD